MECGLIWESVLVQIMHMIPEVMACDILSSNVVL